MHHRLSNLLLLLCLIWAALPGADADERMEHELFITGQTDEIGEPYGAMAEELNLRSLLTSLGVAAQVVLEVKPDRVTSTMRLLRKSDAGEIAINQLTFSELLVLTQSWKRVKPGALDQKLVRGHVEGFMHAAEAYIASTKPK